MDLDGVKHSVEITAGSLFEAAVVGMNAMKVPDWFNRSTLTIEIRVKQPETIHTRVERGPDGVARTQGQDAERDGVEGEATRNSEGVSPKHQVHLPILIW